MKTQLRYLKQLILLGLVLLSLGTSAQEIGGTFDARFEERLGSTLLQNNPWLLTKSTEWTPLTSGYAGAYRGITANFLAEENGTKVAFYFTAETKGHDMEVRALVDGVVIDPGAISFSSDNWEESRSFIFTGTFSEGIHTIGFEWRSLQNNQAAYIRDAAILIRKDDSNNVGQMAIKSQMLNTSVTSSTWEDIPNSNLKIVTKPGDVLIASVALETVVAPGASLYLRAKVNGIPMLPTDVLFAQGNQFQAKTMTFGFHGLGAGRNNVKFQWKVSANGLAGVQGRSFVASAMPADASDCGPHMKFKAAPSGPAVSTNSYIMQPIPNMSMDVSVPENGEMVIVFSAESYASTGEKAMVNLQIGQKYYSASMVNLVSGDKYMGVHSFVFVVKHIRAKGNAGIEQIKLNWSAPNGGTAYMGDRSMAVMVEKGGTPDLAEPPAIGAVDAPLGGGIEPVQGTIPLLAIMIDPERPGVPVPTLGALDELLWGSHSTRDYYDKVSGGRFNLSKAGLLSFKTDEDHEYYWTHHSCDIEEDTLCDDYVEVCISSGYAGGHMKRWLEAIQKADAGGFDFAAYDKNKDNILDPRELAIVIVTPQVDEFGTVRGFNPFCRTINNPDGSYIVDGVKILAMAEWYTSADDSMDFSTPTHELGHLLLNLGDLYIENKEIATEAGQYDLMGENAGASPHLQGRTKLALGWAKPVFVRQSGNFEIENVRTSEDVFILPRINKVDGKEFYLLENRITKEENAGYDEHIKGSGIAIWHIVESEPDYNFTPPRVLCDSNWSATNKGKARRTSRLLRLKVGAVEGGGIANGNNNNTGTGVNAELWKYVAPFNADNSYDLTSFGFACPTQNNQKGTMALTWADNLPSGYAIRNFPMEHNIMDVDIDVPFVYVPNCPDDSDDLDVFAGEDKIVYPNGPTNGWVKLTAYAQGCQGPYTYSWNTGQTTQDIWVNPSVTTTYVVTVTAVGRGCSASDAVLVQVGSTRGTNSREGIESNEIAPQSFCKAFPNPFRENTNFNFTLFTGCEANLSIYNMQGQLIQTVFEGRVEAGLEKQVKWNPTNQANGLYLYRLSSDAGDLIQGKINLIR